MGSATSATADDHRAANKAHKRRHEQKKRRKRRLLKQLPKTDSQGNRLHYDKHGNQFFYDEKEWPYYLDENDKKFYIDSSGQPFYHDENEMPFYLDENGERLYLHENGKEADKDIKESQEHSTSHDKCSQLDLNVRSPVNDLHTEDIESVTSTASTVIKFKVKEQTPVLYKGKEIKQEVGASVDIIDKQAISRMSTNSFLIATGTDLEKEGSISPNSSLSNNGSEFNREALKTPEYIKDESNEVEERRTAQTMAENRILKKLLESEKNKPILPTGKSFRKVGAFNVKVEDDMQDCFISDSGFLSNGNLVLADTKNRKLKMFDPELQLVSTFNLEMYPQKLCCGVKDNIIHMTFKTSIYNGIGVFEAKGNNFVEKTTIKTPWLTGGIGRSKDGLAVMQYKNSTWRIHLMDLKGRLLQEVDLETEGHRLTSPECLKITKDLKLIISDRGANCVYGFNTKGEELFTYKQLREPMGVCMDNTGSLYITSPGIVHQISETGERIRALMKRETTGFSPTSVSYDPEDGLIILTGQSNNMLAYQLT